VEQIGKLLCHGLLLLKVLDGVAVAQRKQDLANDVLCEKYAPVLNTRST